MKLQVDEQAQQHVVVGKLELRSSLRDVHAGGEVHEQAAVPVDKVVDTTGAGDCFTAAFAVARLEGKAAPAALRFAATAAAICVQRAGAMPSLPSRQEADDLVASLK
jgi:ribokinase